MTGRAFHIGLAFPLGLALTGQIVARVPGGTVVLAGTPASVVPTAFPRALFLALALTFPPPASVLQTSLKSFDAAAAVTL